MGGGGQPLEPLGTMLTNGIETSFTVGWHQGLSILKRIISEHKWGTPSRGRCLSSPRSPSES